MQLRTTHATIIVIIWQSNALRAYPRPQTSFCHKKKSETEEGFQTEHDKLWPLLSLSDHLSRLESRLGHIGRTLEHIPTSAVKSQQLLSIATAWSMQLKTTHATVIYNGAYPCPQRSFCHIKKWETGKAYLFWLFSLSLQLAKPCQGQDFQYFSPNPQPPKQAFRPNFPKSVTSEQSLH